MNINEVISLLKQKTHGRTVPGPDAIFQFHLLGDGGGDLYAQLAGGQVIVAQGNAPVNDAAITMDIKDLDGIMHGRADATSLYFMGKIRVQGDLMLAMRLANLLA